MRNGQLQQILNDLNGSTADIEASVLISVDGLMMASALPQGMDEDRVGAMTAALLTVMAKKNAKLGLIFLDMNRAAESLARLI